MPQDISLELLKQVLHYDPLTGLFRYLVTLNNNGAQAGMAAGTKEGAIDITLFGVMYRAHRLAWFYMTGNWPNQEIDHRDGDHRNNRWKNLRQATHAQNMKNMRRRVDNTSGFKGVSRHRDKWIARVYVDGICHRLGRYDSPELADAVAREFRAKAHGEFAKHE